MAPRPDTVSQASLNMKAFVIVSRDIGEDDEFFFVMNHDHNNHHLDHDHDNYHNHHDHSRLPWWLLSLERPTLTPSARWRFYPFS